MSTRRWPGVVSLAVSTWTAIGLLTAGCGAGSSGPVAPRVELEPCTETSLRDADCGVARRAENPYASSDNGRDLELRLIVLRSLDGEGKGAPIYYLTGGPGVAATTLAAQWNDSPLRQRHEIVFVDQRGTSGEQALHCPVLGLQAAFDFVLLSRLPDAAACAERLASRADLSQYTTTRAAEDLDAVRAALGHERVHLLANSYGTRLAQVYLRSHGDRVTGVALRGVLPLGVQMPRDYGGADAALDALFDTCQLDAACRQRLAGRDRLAGLLERLRAQGPTELVVVDPRTRQPARVVLTVDHVVEVVRLLLFDSRAAAHLPHLLALADEGDLLPLAQAGADIVGSVLPGVSVGMMLSVLCAEDAPFLPTAQAQAATDSLFALGTRIENLRQSCAVWPVVAVPPQFHQPLESFADAAVLLLSGAVDPVTPPAGAEAAARVDGSAVRHVVLPGTAHAPMRLGCVEEVLTRFFDLAAARRDGSQLELDDLDTSCLDELRRPDFVFP